MCSPDEVIFESRLFKVGSFACQPGNPWFGQPRIMPHDLVVFPRTSVYILKPDHEPIVANPNLVLLYNRGQVYTRRSLAGRGDRCEWFAFERELLADVIRPYDSRAADLERPPFRFPHGPSDPKTYILQRLVVQHVRDNEQPDPLFMEETVLVLLERVMENAYRIAGVNGKNGADANPAHLELTRAVQALVSTRFRESLSLSDIGEEIGYSPYHLSRVFRRQTGITIHRFLNHLRLQTALEYVVEDEEDLTHIALTLGFSSHSHFTQAFRQTFGMPPSALRRKEAHRHLRELRKFLIA